MRLQFSRMRLQRAAVEVTIAVAAIRVDYDAALRLPPYRSSYERARNTLAPSKARALAAWAEYEGRAEEVKQRTEG